MSSKVSTAWAACRTCGKLQDRLEATIHVSRAYPFTGRDSKESEPFQISLIYLVGGPITRCRPQSAEMLEELEENVLSFG